MREGISAFAIFAFAWAAQAGGAQAKFELCHEERVISVAEPAVAAHLAHGDRLGACLPDRIYASTDPGDLICQDPSVIACPSGYAPFSDATGCGCERR